MHPNLPKNKIISTSQTSLKIKIESNRRDNIYLKVVCLYEYEYYDWKGKARYNTRDVLGSGEVGLEIRLRESGPEIWRVSP